MAGDLAAPVGGHAATQREDRLGNLPDARRARRAIIRSGRQVVAPHNLWRLYLASGLAAIAAVYMLGGPDLRTWSLPAFAALGAAGLALGARRSRTGRCRSWYGLALGVLLVGLGDLVWAALGKHSLEFGVLTLADPIYLAGYAAAIVSLGSLTLSRRSGTDLDVLVDTGIASLGAALVTWVFLIAPSLNQAAGSAAVATVVHAILDWALLVVLLGVLMGPQRSRSLGLLSGAVLAFIVSDVLYLRDTPSGNYVSGGWPDLGWFGGYVAWGAAGIHPSARSLGEFRRSSDDWGVSLSRAVGVVGSCLIAPAMVLWAWQTGRTADLPPIALAGIVLTMLWASRLGLTVRRLQRSLDERAALEWQLREQAERDALLGLPNRASFLARLRTTLASGQAVAVLYVDLDNFKTINDTCGHPAGDEALIEVARRVESLLRPPDIAARLGGDEFGVLLPAADAPSAVAVASRLLERLERPISVAGREMFVHASVGVSRGGPEKAADDLIREADVAMYLAKGKGKSRQVLFEAEMHADVMRRIALRSDLEQALALRQFTVLYQPIVTMPGGVARDCEALARWQHPVRGLLSPEEFIDLAEKTGVIVDLGRWLLSEACREAARWSDELGGSAPGVAVNVSALQVSRPGFAEEVAGALDRTRLDPHRLAVEITESTLIEVESATSVVRDLSKTGVRVAIDHFGAGYSALSYLTTYPVDILKIDRSFVAALDSGPGEARLASAIVALGKDLGLQVVAEGVETESQLHALVKHGCTAFQGYLFARPMAGRDLMPLLAAASSRHEPFTHDLRPLRKSA
jgi:diguanylate cyclase (GGDEF)-like protein